MLKHFNPANKAAALFAAVLSLCFSFATIAPQWALGERSTLGAFVAIFALGGVTFFFLFLLLAFLPGSTLKKTPQEAFRQTKLLWLIAFLSLETVFFFSLASNYPGFCSTDSNDIIAQAMGSSSYENHHRYDGVANHHPVFYTFFVWLVLKATASFGNIHTSVFCFLLLQSLFVSLCLSWAIAWLNRHTSHKSFVVIVLLFFIFSPILAAHAITAWKDAPFSVLLLVTTLFLFDLSRSQTIGTRQAIKLACLLALLSLLRNNGLYVSVALLLYMLVFFKQSRIVLAKCGAALLVFVAIFQGPIFSLFSVQSGHFSESVGIPLQQIACTISSDGTISEEQEDFLGQILPLEEWAEKYNPISPNPLKFSENFNDSFLESNKTEFLRIWFSMLPSNLGCYARAWILETRGYWQPGFQADIGTLCSLNYEDPTDLIGLGWNPVQAANSLRADIPLLFDMGSYIWMTLLAVLICVSRKNADFSLQRRLTCFIPLLALFGTILIAAPTVGDYRYVLCLYLVIPFLPTMSTAP